MKCQPASELDSLPDKCEQVTSFAALRLLFCVCRVRLEVVKRAAFGFPIILPEKKISHV